MKFTLKFTFSTTFFLLFFGCSNLTKDKSFLTGLIDSENRGESIFNSEGVLIGKTPFYFEYSGDRSEEFFYKDDGETSSFTIKCERLGNFLFGYFFNCPEYYKIKNINGSKDVKPPALLVRPRPKWEIPNSIRTEIEKRYLIVEDSEMNERLDLYDSHPFNLEDFKSDPEYILKVAKKSKIKFIIFFFPDPKNSQNINPIVVDIRKKIIIDSFVGTETSIKTGQLEGILKIFNFFPNSISFNYFFQGRVEGKKDGVKFKSDKRDVSRQSDFIPNFFPVIGIENIIYPIKYDGFKVRVRFSPSINSYSFKFTDNIDNELYILEAFGLGAYYNAQLNIIYNSILISYGLGIGLIYEDSKDTQSFSKTGMNINTRTFGSLTWFATKRWFLQLGLSNFSLSEDLRDQGSYGPEGFTEYFFGLGFYFPEIKFY